MISWDESNKDSISITRHDGFDTLCHIGEPVYLIDDQRFSDRQLLQYMFFVDALIC